jgi:tetratricopeptide (TPR) repeat protein
MGFRKAGSLHPSERIRPMAPLFGGKSRPKLDGLTKEEEKQRDSLNAEVLRRAGEKGVAGQMPAAAAILREKTDAETGEYLWPLLLGIQMRAMHRFDQSVEAFMEAVKRSPKELRAYFGAGNAYWDAGQARHEAAADAPTVAGTFPELTVDNLFHEAKRNFVRAQELTDDKEERERLRNAIANCVTMLARRAGRI